MSFTELPKTIYDKLKAFLAQRRIPVQGKDISNQMVHLEFQKELTKEECRLINEEIDRLYTELKETPVYREQELRKQGEFNERGQNVPELES